MEQQVERPVVEVFQTSSASLVVELAVLVVREAALLVYSESLVEERLEAPLLAVLLAVV